MFQLFSTAATRLLVVAFATALLMGLTGCTLPPWLGGSGKEATLALPPDIPPPVITAAPTTAEAPTSDSMAGSLDSEMLSAALEHAITLGLLPTGTTIAALETPITRGELAVWLKTFVVAIPILSNKKGAVTPADKAKAVEDEDPDTHTFADILPDHPQFGAIEQAAKNGWIGGRFRSGESVFDPDTSVNRWMLCVALAKAQQQLETPSLTEPTPDTPPPPLPVDWATVPVDARPMVRLALNNQVAATLFGLDDALLASQGLRPDAPVTRAQALFAFYHYL
ncbi:MAG: hypothetical protein QE263_01370 [Vampirovibrionales bacterium]|nr:hypothetical protein [Vampirovibrionales bacterium]